MRPCISLGTAMPEASPQNNASFALLVIRHTAASMHLCWMPERPQLLRDPAEGVLNSATNLAFTLQVGAAANGC